MDWHCQQTHPLTIFYGVVHPLYCLYLLYCLFILIYCVWQYRHNHNECEQFVLEPVPFLYSVLTSVWQTSLYTIHQYFHLDCEIYYVSQNILTLRIYFGVACQYIRLNILFSLKKHRLITNNHSYEYSFRGLPRTKCEAGFVSILRASIFCGHSFIYLHSDFVAVNLECVKEFFSSTLHSSL